MVKKVVAPPAAAGILVQTDLGPLECTAECHGVCGSVQVDKRKRTTSTTSE